MEIRNGTQRVFKGMPVTRGYVSGEVFLLRTSSDWSVSEIKVENLDGEILRFDLAISLTGKQIAAVVNELKNLISGKEVEIFESHQTMLEDPELIAACKKCIREKKINAEAAVWHVAEYYAGLFSKMGDPYLRERGKDIIDVAKRLIKTLLGEEAVPALKLTKPCIIVTDDLSPSETIALPKEMILGLAVDRGSQTCHAALLARALGIPTVVALQNLSRHVHTGDFLLLDGSQGKVVVRPTSAEKEDFFAQEYRSQQLDSAIEAGREQPGLMRDGYPVPVMANVDASTSLETLASLKVEGVGLYRSEYLLISKNREPSEDEQTQAYIDIARALPPGAPVTIRVLDLGGDKVMNVDSIQMRHEANPFLGNRSIRFLLRNREVFRRQLRAILRASAIFNIRVMYPMIATVEEVIEANAELEFCKAQLYDQGIPFNDDIKKGVMIEIPSAALIADDLASYVDFFSLGTNDLIQYTLAVDRLNETVAQLYQPTHPGVLHLIGMSIDAAHRHGIQISVCGETSSDPFIAVLLLGMGIDCLSMAPSLIPMAKWGLRQITLEDAKALAMQVRNNRKGKTAAQIYRMTKSLVLKLIPELIV